MAHITITCWGSHGDTDPYLGLAAGLSARGHDVAIATLEHYRPLVERGGYRFFPIRPAGDPTDTRLVERVMDRNRGTEFLLREVIVPGIPDMYNDLQPAIDGADLVISHPLTMAAPMLAEQRQIAWVSTVLAPMSFFSEYDVPVFPPAPWLKRLERLGAWPGRLLTRLAKRVTAQWVEPVRDMRRTLGLPDRGNPLFEGQHSPHLVLALYSAVLGAPQPDWPAHVMVTGHMFHDAPHGTSLSAELENFLAAGPPPLVFTLGSSAILVAGDFWQTSVGAVEALGQRAVFLMGPGKAGVLRDTLPSCILAVDGAPHSLLFPRASVVVQQCGIGTIAQSLRSGRPLLAVPWAHDQPDNAHRTARLGMARVLQASAYRVPAVITALRDLLSTPDYTRAAASVAERVRTERGVDAACDALEARFSLQRA